MTTTALARTWLFVPADRQDRFEKAATSGADRVIIDLEDAVTPEAKHDVRRALVGATIPTTVPFYIRVNGVGTEWFQDDISVAATLPIAGIILPKANGENHVARVAAALTGARPVVPIIETAHGVWNVGEVAHAPRVERLIFGALDFELDSGILDGDDSHAYARSRIAIASKVARLAPPIDAVTIAIDDTSQLTRDTQRARRFGFGGKMCIHPKQIATVHAAFAPTEAEVEWARELLAECERRGDGAAFQFRGTMIDRPVVERARHVAMVAGLAT